MDRVRWGVLSTADIAVRKVIPGFRRSRTAEVVAIASRDEGRAAEAAERLGIPRSYGTYDALLSDTEIDAVYIPLPNHLHIPWTLRAVKAGKHVLVEKPAAIDYADLHGLFSMLDRLPPRLVMEAFMYRHHPQWTRAQQLIREGAIGGLLTVHTHFSYYNDNPDDIRNKGDIGGGALLDIGCYAVSVPRFLFGTEPQRVCAVMDVDPRFKCDRLTSALLQFGSGSATFTVGTQMENRQEVIATGEAGSIRLQIPFNAPPEEPCTVTLTNRDGTQVFREGPFDQYGGQADAFAAALDDAEFTRAARCEALLNMSAVTAIEQSARSGGWIKPAPL